MSNSMRIVVWGEPQANPNIGGGEIAKLGDRHLHPGLRAVAEDWQAAPSPRDLRIGYLPYGGITNQYAERFVEILAAFGSVSDLPRPKSLLRRPAGLRRRFDLAILNWIELDMVRQGDGAFSVPGFLKVLARVLFFKWIARRVAYVRHNNFPHGTRKGDEARARRAIDFIERCVDVVLTHSGHDLAGRRRYLPHPLYRPVAGALDGREAALLAALPEGYYAVFGRIARYKRIEHLLADFPPERRLVVFGAAAEPDYVADLQRMARPNVHIHAGYVSEALAQAVVRRSRGLILCHAERDMIVSGSLFYALSLGAPVFALETPAVAWIRTRIGDESICVAADVAGLCALVAHDAAPRAGTAARRPVVESEFGDARIRAALTEVFFEVFLP